MSEQSGGPGWWVASDGKWYPPEQAPDAAPAAPVPPTAAAPTAGQPPNSNGNKGKIIAAVVVAAVLVIGIVIAVTRDSGGSKGGSLEAFCASSADFRSDTITDNSDISSDERNQIALDRLEALDKIAPAEIKPDVDTLVEGSKVIIDISKGDLSKIKDFDQAKMTKAGQNLEKFLIDKCGVDLESDASS